MNYVYLHSNHNNVSVHDLFNFNIYFFRLLDLKVIAFLSDFRVQWFVVGIRR